MRKLLKQMAFVLLIAMMFSVSVHAEETAGQYENLANVLKDGGFFRGYEDGTFRLNQGLTRAEGAVMLVRMLGKEQEIEGKTYSHPFDDVPAWADSYVGYLYQERLTNGIAANKYGSTNQVTAEQYFTFVLRALGYDDSIGEFRWDRSLEKAMQLGMIDSVEYTKMKGNAFLRDYAVLATYRGLNSAVNGKAIALAEYLYNNGDITERAMLAVMAAVEGGEADKTNDAKKLLVLGENAYITVESATIDESLNMLMTGIDPNSGETVTIMDAELNQTAYRSQTLTEKKVAIISDLVTYFFGLDINEYKEIYIDADHFYRYVESSSSLTGDVPAIEFADLYGDPAYSSDYAAAVGDLSLAIDLDTMRLAPLSDFSSFEVTETDTAYIISADESALPFLNTEDQIVSGDVSSLTLQFTLDKETGILTECVIELGAESDDGYSVDMTYTFNASDINGTTVEIPENIAGQL